MALQNYKAAYGDSIAYDVDGSKATYAVINQLTPGVNGVSARDLVVAHAVLLAAIVGEI
jgi:hypothetical protein